MRSHRIRSGRSALRMLAGASLALGVLAGSAATAFAATAPHAAPARTHSAVPNAPTSSFVTYTKSNYRGKSHNITGCGGHNLPLPIKSYSWTGDGQNGLMYNQKHEAGKVVFTLHGNQNTKSPHGVGWKSILINC